MHTFAPARTRRHTRFGVITTRRTEFVDITDRIKTFVGECGVDTGLVNIQSLHTTTAIVLNEHEPLLLSDFSTLLGRVAPRAAWYRHDDFETRTVNMTPEERANGHAHCRALLLGPTASLNIVDGRIERGRWQRVFLAELDGPRSREVSVIVMG